MTEKSNADKRLGLPLELSVEQVHITKRLFIFQLSTSQRHSKPAILQFTSNGG